MPEGADLSQWTETLFVEQRRLWPVWLAVAFGTGVACYFALPIEPPIWAGIAGLAVGGVGEGGGAVVEGRFIAFGKDGGEP